MRGPRIASLIAGLALAGCASTPAGVATSRAALPTDCLERATALSRSSGPLPSPDASHYWLSLSTLGSPSAATAGPYGIEAAYREMVYRECREETVPAASPRNR